MTGIQTPPQPPRENIATDRPAKSRRSWRRRAGIALAGLVVAFGLIQFIPYGRGKNPPVTKAAVWPNAQAQSIAENACYDCHSNLTKRWWGTKVAPASWLAQSDVNGGRDTLNFSEWDKPQAGLNDVVEAVKGSSMPPIQYKLVHGNARLSTTQREQLAAALKQLYAKDPPAGTKHGGD